MRHRGARSFAFDIKTHVGYSYNFPPNNPSHCLGSRTRPSLWRLSKNKDFYSETVRSKIYMIYYNKSCLDISVRRNITLGVFFFFRPRISVFFVFQRRDINTDRFVELLPAKSVDSVKKRHELSLNLPRRRMTDWNLTRLSKIVTKSFDKSFADLYKSSSHFSCQLTCRWSDKHQLIFPFVANKWNVYAFASSNPQLAVPV